MSAVSRGRAPYLTVVRALPFVLMALAALIGLGEGAVEVRRRLLWPSDDGLPLRGNAIGFVISVIGLLIARAQPRNVIGWIFLGTGLASAVQLAVAEYARAVLVLGAPDVLGTAVLFEWTGWWTWVATSLPGFVFVPMFFPDGRLLSRRWWPLPALGTTGAILVAVSIALTPVPDDVGTRVRIANPYGIDAPWLGPLLAMGIAAVMLAMGGTLVSLALRMRRGGALERQQLKIFFFAALVWPVFGVFGVLTQFRWVPPGVVLVMLTLALPVAIGIAILRYRLYDIDLLINRTLVYGSLSATLLGTYLLSVLGLSAVLRPLTGSSELAVAGSTLAVVALFGPLRARIQRFVDRRFYRSRYDTARTLDAFGARLRNEVDLDSVRADLLDVVHDTVRPAHASVWLRERTPN